MSSLIEGYPARSFTGQMLSWGRSGRYAPSLLPEQESIEAIAKTQSDLQTIAPGATMLAAEKLHSTLLFCPPRHIFNAIYAARGKNPKKIDPFDEARFYSDLTVGLGSLPFWAGQYSATVPVFSLEHFDDEANSIVLTLDEEKGPSVIRRNVRELLVHNLGFHGIKEPGVLETIKKDPQLKWLFEPSIPHMTIAKNVPRGLELEEIAKPENITFDRIHIDSPSEFFGFNSIKFDPEAAFEALEDEDRS